MSVCRSSVLRCYHATSCMRSFCTSKHVFSSNLLFLSTLLYHILSYPLLPPLSSSFLPFLLLSSLSTQEAFSSSQQSNSADRSALLSLETERADIRAITHTVRSNVKTLRGECAAVLSIPPMSSSTPHHTAHCVLVTIHCFCSCFRFSSCFCNCYFL